MPTWALGQSSGIRPKNTGLISGVAGDAALDAQLRAAGAKGRGTVGHMSHESHEPPFVSSKNIIACRNNELT